jgi:tetratricopeptide (TPR) repeat protein
MNSIREYSENVDSLEEFGGAWDSGLTEQLASIGSLEQQQGNHIGAIEAFDRAIHINRISDGLHTLDQIPMVEEMVESYLALGDWENTELYNNYLFFVQQKVYGTNDPRIIPVLDRLASWNMQAFNIGYGAALGVRLSSAQMLFSVAVRMVVEHFGRDDERFIRYLRNLAISAYQVARYPQYKMEVDRPEYRNGQQVLRQKLNERMSILPQGYNMGLAALQDILSYQSKKPDNAYAMAEAITHLADWFLMFGRRRTADDFYLQAWELLAAEENSDELIQKLFGQVVVLPAFITEPRNLKMNRAAAKSRNTLNYAYADISLDVTEAGRPRNIEVLSEETEENAYRLSQLRREVRASTFRPMLVEGKLERTNGQVFRYRYWY